MKKILAYQIQGSGKVVVFLHGFCESSAIWNQFVEVLSQSYKVITIDLGGFGASADMLPVEVSIEQLAEQVYNTLDALRIQRYVMVAHSLGGYVALALAEAHPRRLRGLGLIHSTALPDSEEKQKIRNNVIDFVAKNGVAPFIQNFVAPLFYPPRHAELQESIDFVTNIALQTPAESLMQVSAAMRDRKDRTHVLKTARYPVLFVIGKQDQAVLLETYAQQIFLPKHSLVQILDETAHMGMFERPTETLAMVQALLRQCFQ